MWELNCEESWAPKNWCFWTVVLEKTLWVPWPARRSNHSILKEVSPGCSLEILMLKLKLQYFGHLMQRVDSLEKTDAGRDWWQEEKGTTENEMAGWHHWLDGHEFGWTQGVDDGQGGLTCCNSWGRKESDMTEWLNWTESQFSLTLHNPTVCSPPGSSVHWILQARMPEWVAIPLCRGSSQPKVWTWVSCIADGFSTIWATREVHVEWNQATKTVFQFTVNFLSR